MERRVIVGEDGKKRRRSFAPECRREAAHLVIDDGRHADLDARLSWEQPGADLRPELTLFRPRVRGCSGGLYRRSPVTSFIQFDGPPATPSDQVLLPPVEPSQHASETFAETMTDDGICASCGRRGVLGHLPLGAKRAGEWNNAWAESFNATLKNERIHRRVYPTREKAIRDTVSWIELRHNHLRLHSSPGYWTPDEVEAEYLAVARQSERHLSPRSEKHLPIHFSAESCPSNSPPGHALALKNPSSCTPHACIANNNTTTMASKD